MKSSVLFEVKFQKVIVQSKGTLARDLFVRLSLTDSCSIVRSWRRFLIETLPDMLKLHGGGDRV